MTKIFFLRHGLTKANIEERIQGQQPGELLFPEAERYLAAVVPLLRRHTIEILASSDLARGIVSRQILKKFLASGVPSINVKELELKLLREQDVGRLDGYLWSKVPLEIKKQRGLPNLDFHEYGGETPGELRGRVDKTLRHLLKIYANKTICCIVHGAWFQQLVDLAGQEAHIPDQWSNRSAIYEATLQKPGIIRNLLPLIIEGDTDFAVGRL